MKRLAIAAAELFLLSALILGARVWNAPEVLVDGRIFFVDADCYSRMTRVKQIEEGGRSVVGHHGFENYPDGVAPHTTLPLDWIILGLARLVGSRDLAGAIVSPLLGLLTGIFLWWWSRRLKLRGRWLAPILYAVSPILAHGTALGRPDHQSLLILCVAVALGAEWALTSQPTRGWAVTAGAAWGLGLWVSLYEPLVLLALVVVLRAAFQPRALWTRASRVEWAALVAVIAVSLVFERSPHLAWPDATVREYFPRWKQSIGELASVTPLSPLLYRWVGLGLLASPVLLGFAARKDRRAIPALVLLVAVWGLTLVQIRWGYFLALAFAMSLPIQIEAVPRMWPVWIVFAVSLWPVASDWEERLFPDGPRRAQLAERRLDAVLLRNAADSMREGGGILAPWWLSPPLAYWTGLPCVAGSSHESLPGTVAAARFFLTSSTEEAQIILERRKVRWVVAYDPSRVLQTSASLIGRNPGPTPMATLLYGRPRSAPPYLRLEYSNQFFRVFRADDSILQQ